MINSDSINNTLLEFIHQLPDAKKSKRDLLMRDIRDLLAMLPEAERTEWESKLECLEALGLGDRVESLLKVTGLHQTVKAVERITGRPCGCQKRKEKLNEWGRRLTGQSPLPEAEP